MLKDAVVRFTFLLVLSTACCTAATDANAEYTNIQASEKSSTALSEEIDNRLLLFSTLDGSLYAIEQQTGNVVWKSEDQPAVRVPSNTSEAIYPLFLPDPTDGSLYLLGGKDVLKKLPFTIPQLVASSPCRSSDGILYTGKKKDSWFILDPKSGSKEYVLGFDGTDPKCPVASPDSVYIGRTQYVIMMIDAKLKRTWNITFYDYSASSMTKDMLSQYDLVHLTTNSVGKVVTLNQRIGKVLWERDLGSPVVNAYMLGMEGFLHVPFTSVSADTLKNLVLQFTSQTTDLPIKSSDLQLFPTLYVGEHLHGLYALPSLVDADDVTISAGMANQLLLEGPSVKGSKPIHIDIPMPGQNIRLNPKQVYVNVPTFQSVLPDQDPLVILLGHYNVPEYSNIRLQITGKSGQLLGINFEKNESQDDPKPRLHLKAFRFVQKHDGRPVLSVGVQTDGSENLQILSKFAPKTVLLWFVQQENIGLKLLLVLLVACICLMFLYLRKQVREFQILSQNGSKQSERSNHSASGGSSISVPEDVAEGVVRIGKITFYTDQLLGKGCDGTFVYKGEFDERPVAVKRLLPECFTFADREVQLLRESDEHPNVVRYFCTEQDRMFRYIALELCEATVNDYVQGRYDTSLITPLNILQQATSGLAHLHSLDIVHRDIKPQNVLLSIRNSRGGVRAMISDFGLCKKLQTGRTSFSRRSGVTGTDGWIAPEMLNGERTTCAVDMFSLGCLFYFVLSEGKHPFGDALRRQANILSGEFRIGDLKGDRSQVELSLMLINKLICSDPGERPPASVVLSFPLFWSATKVLAFLQDVSDRVEKADAESPVLRSLERHGTFVIRLDWRQHIDPEVAEDLRKYRNYRGDSVRDLLRALRNKKHHYRELSAEAQHSLGEVPEKFTTYWTSRFPLLMLHTWLAMQLVRTEPTFQQYYDKNHCFMEQNYRDTCYDVRLEREVAAVAAAAAAEDALHLNRQAAPDDDYFSKPAPTRTNLDEIWRKKAEERQPGSPRRFIPRSRPRPSDEGSPDQQLMRRRYRRMRRGPAGDNGPEPE